MTKSLNSAVCRLSLMLAAVFAICLAAPQASMAALSGSGGWGTQSAHGEAGDVPLLIQNLDIKEIGRPDLPDIIVSYPSVGVGAIDADIEAWIRHIVYTFERDCSEILKEASGEGADVRCSLNSTYRVLRPSPAALSIVFELWMDTGGVHPGLDVITLNYSLITEQRLAMVDIFEDTSRALAVMSEYSREVLAAGVGGGRVDQMIAAGTEPVPENFANMALIPGGVRVFFQPYQVAPWSAGTQTVDIPLDKLRDARPLMALWGLQ